MTSQRNEACRTASRAEWPVTIVRDGQQPMRTPLHAMDRETFDHLTSVWIPAVPDDATKAVPTIREPSKQHMEPTEH